MGTLVLVRHGQARPFEKDSDQLSPVGEVQARRLGQFWLRQKLRFDEIYSGTLIRQQRTAELVAACFAEARQDWPQLQTLAELNEYDADGIINRLIPALAARDAAFAQALLAFEQNRHAPDRNRYFQKMFERVTATWLSGEFEIEGVEAWCTFCARVRDTLKRILNAEGSGRRVAIFTSGGVIGLAVQTALDAPEQAALQLNWRVRNCSLTEFVFGRDRLSLDSFNTIPHLDDPLLQTYR